MPTPSTANPLGEYTPKPGHFDEALGGDGALRPTWDVFLNSVGSDPAAAFQQAADYCRRVVVEQDVSMNVYSGEQSAAKPWPLDPLPLLIAADEWRHLSEGLRQRARLVNTLLQDLYGPQKFLREGVLPAALAMANPQYLRPCAGLGNPRQPALHTCAFDLARSPDGQWWVISDRLDAPSGLGYSLQNRIIVRNALQGAFARAPVHKLYQFFHDFQTSLLHWPGASPDARAVVLSSGPANETYYEHAYLARYLGCPLVEGADLTTRDRQVYLRTIGGLKRVDVIMRRVDSEFCDPLELNPESVLGVPGLVHAAHAGTVSITNQLGAEALETVALLAFLQPLCRHVFHEDLLIPSVATWWCGQEKARRYALDHLDSLVFKPTFRESTAPATRYGAILSTAERAELAADLQARPWAYCGQERVFLGTTPAWIENSLKPVPFVLRAYLCWHDGDFRVLPGGLTRFNPTGEDAIVSLQRGSITKDTWVLSEDVVEEAPVLIIERNSADRRRASATASRLADDLFWLGRYLERTAHLARTLDKLDPVLRDEIAMLDPAVAIDAARFLVTFQTGFVTTSDSLEQLAGSARRSAADAKLPDSLAANLGRLVRVLDQVKVRLPAEAWRILRTLRFTTDSGIPGNLRLLSEPLSALEGLAAETLPHDASWRFLELGRRIERSQQLVFLFRSLLVAIGDPVPSELRLQTLLHFADSLFMYRSTFHGQIQPASAVAWLINEPENPRGLRYQAELISTHLDALPDEQAPAAVEALRTRAFHLLSLTRLADASATANWKTLFNDLRSDLEDLNHRITQVYFAHADPLGEGR